MKQLIWFPRFINTIWNYKTKAEKILVKWKMQQLPHKVQQASDKRKVHVLFLVCHLSIAFAFLHQDPWILWDQSMVVCLGTSMESRQKFSIKQTKLQLLSGKCINWQLVDVVKYLRTCSYPNNCFHKLQERKKTMMSHIIEIMLSVIFKVYSNPLSAEISYQLSLYCLNIQKSAVTAPSL